MKKVKILKTNINEITLEDVTSILTSSKNLTVAVCNANSLVRAYKNKLQNNVIESFDIRLPDGFPVARKVSKIIQVIIFMEIAKR